RSSRSPLRPSCEAGIGRPVAGEGSLARNRTEPAGTIALPAASLRNLPSHLSPERVDPSELDLRGGANRRLLDLAELPRIEAEGARDEIPGDGANPRVVDPHPLVEGGAGLLDLRLDLAQPMLKVEEVRVRLEVRVRFRESQEGA